MQIETTGEIGIPSAYTHEFQFNDENTDIKKELAKKEYVELEYID